MENPILVERRRGDILESFHRGVVCMVDREGEVIFSVGDIEQVCYPRSALKLFQVIPLIESGAADHFNFTLEEIALMCGSHNGEAAHLQVLEVIFKKIGLGAEYLQCGNQWPTLTEDRNRMVKLDELPKQVHNNCSGKHAGFLAMCVHAGYPLENYLDPQHPLQLEIKRVTAEIHEYPIEKIATAIDGCSAPIFSLPVINQAIGYKNIVYPAAFHAERQRACQIIIEAMQQFPYMVAGAKRYCTEMMELCGEHVIGKTGADGVYSLGFIDEHIGCTIKVDDGLMGPQYAIAQEIIEKSGVCKKRSIKALHHYIEEPIINWAGTQTGTAQVKADMFEDFPVLAKM